jgi:hypothetical protein
MRADSEQTPSAVTCPRGAACRMSTSHETDGDRCRTADADEDDDDVEEAEEEDEDEEGDDDEADDARSHRV